MKKEQLPERLTNENYFAPWTSFNVQRYKVVATWPVHWHEFYELEFIMKGQGCHVVNGMKQPMSAGSLFFLTPADFHEVSPEGGSSMELINVKFSDELISNELREIISCNTAPFWANFKNSEYQSMEADFMRLLAEFEGNGLGKDLVLKSTLERIIIDLIRNSHQNKENIISQPVYQVGHSIHRSLVYLQHHFREPVTLEQIAQESNLSANYFSECFHHSTGKTFKGYLHELRINFAASLIKCSDLPVTEICFASGFNSLPHFLRSFKQHFGMSPNAYRKQYTAQVQVK
jgi:AraC-like DNA-binding protein/mannose-6-phosphate isomerase-like protein (cupin superfamily)